jgi:hypothetical protein
MTDRTDPAPAGPATAGQSSSASQAGPEKVRCVLWHAPGDAMPGDLLSTLSRRIAHFTVCTDAYAALAHVCAVERDRRAGLARGETHPASLLVLIEPDRLDEAELVVQAVRFYAPGCTMRRYNARAAVRFAPVDTSAERAEGGRGAGPVANTPRMGMPTLRLSGDAAVQRNEPTAPAPTGVTLTVEELQMLLGDEPLPPPAPGRSADRRGIGGRP